MGNRYVWLVEEGEYYHDDCPVILACNTKSVAVKRCRADGFKYHKNDDFWCNEKTRLYRNVWREALICE